MNSDHFDGGSTVVIEVKFAMPLQRRHFIWAIWSWYWPTLPRSLRQIVIRDSPSLHLCLGRVRLFVSTTWAIVARFAPEDLSLSLSHYYFFRCCLVQWPIRTVVSSVCQLILLVSIFLGFHLWLIPLLHVHVILSSLYIEIFLPACAGVLFYIDEICFLWSSHLSCYKKKLWS